MKNLPLRKTFFLISLASSSAAFAGTETDIQALKERLAKLEQQSKTTLLNNISIAGVIEVEAGITDSDGYSDHSYSDIVLSTVELGMEAKINEGVSANVIALYEDDGAEKLDIDVASIKLSNMADMGLDITLGQDYLPFGRFETNMINDTLALEMAEIRETSAMASYRVKNFTATAYLFNGDVDTGGDRLKNVGVSFNFEGENFSYGADYISNIADSDTISSTLTPVATSLSETPSAMVLRGKFNSDTANLTAELFRAEDFNAVDWGLGPSGKRYQPQAVQLEISTTLQNWTLAAAAQRSEESVIFGVPEYRYSLAGSTEVSEGVSLAIEFYHDKDYKLTDGGTDESANSVIAQLAVSF